MSSCRSVRVGKTTHVGGQVVDYVVSLPITDETERALGITMTPDRNGWVVGGYVGDLATWHQGWRTRRAQRAPPGIRATYLTSDQEKP